MTRNGIISLPSLLVALVAMAVAALVLEEHAHLLYYGARPLPYRIASDSDAYIKIASGHLADVESPFSKRILYPFLVGKIAGWLHIDLGTAFLAANFLCFGLLAYGVAACLEKTVDRPYLALIPLLSGFGFESLSLAYLPDLFHAAFTSLFFLLLLKEQRLAAFVILFFLCLARDNTFFLCVVLAAVAWWRNERFLLRGALVVLVLGVVVSSIMARGGKPNIHHLAEPLYLALKVPYNLLGNVLGIFFWTDMREGMGTPLFVRPIPHLFRLLSSDTQIGIVFDPHQVLTTCIVLSTIFGTGPLILWHFRDKWASLTPTLPVQLAMVYGVLSYFLGVSLGNWVFRLVGYGWPAFWIALPYLLVRTGYRPPTWKAAALIGCFLTSSWLLSLMQESVYHWTVILPVTAVLYGLTFALLRGGPGDLPAAAEEKKSGRV